MQGLYLLHFAPGYRHARHYLGYSDDVARRFREHVTSSPKSSPLVRAALGAGSVVVLARVWPGGDRKLERRLKKHNGLGAHCPLCRGDAVVGAR